MQGRSQKIKQLEKINTENSLSNNLLDKIDEFALITRCDIHLAFINLLTTPKALLDSY